MAHILIIDDEPAVRKLFEQFMESSGHSVSSAANGREGILLLKKRQTDLVITDILMPEMDGLEFLLEIRKLHLELAVDVPVIAISGGMKSLPINFLKQAKSFGAARIFEKPVKLEEMLAAVRELLSENLGLPA
ncbi:MAG: response regulator [Kiritimatiellales bacterium]|jgi:CheY-like chemotaxis protein